MEGLIRMNLRHIRSTWLLHESIREAHGLTKEFAGFVATNNLNLRVRRGSIHADVRPSEVVALLLNARSEF